MSLKEEIQTAIDSGQKVLVDYYRDACPPCKAVAMQINKIVSDNPDILVFKVKANNTDEETAMFVEKNIQSVPQLYLYQDKVEIGRLAGAQPYSKIVGVFK